MSGTASSIVAILQTGVAPAIIVGIVLWNADKAISKAGAENLYKAIRQSADSPSESKVAAAIDGFLTRYFADRLGTVRFFRNVFVLTASSLLILLSIYAYKTPGMTSVLLTKGFFAPVHWQWLCGELSGQLCDVLGVSSADPENQPQFRPSKLWLCRSRHCWKGDLIHYPDCNYLCALCAIWKCFWR